MVNLMSEVPLELHVGDKKAISQLFLKQTRIDVLPLTDYAAWVTMAYVGAAPHIIRGCKVDASGFAVYEMQGDELTQEGTVEVYFTAVLHTPSAAGGGSNDFRFSGAIKRILVRRAPQ